jgi:type II secretory pathway component PulF
LTENTGWFAAGYAVLVLGVALLFFASISGPRGPRLHPFGRWLDWLAYHLPWRNKLLKRDFSLALGLLLDADVPEGEAVRQAGKAAGNRHVQLKSEAIAAQLSRGVPLAKAIAGFDEQRQFQWRLGTAMHAGRGFVRALHGWHQSLEAEAFRKEQAAAQFTTTFLLMINGAAVCLIVMSIFGMFVAMLNQAVLW